MRRLLVASALVAVGCGAASSAPVARDPAKPSPFEGATWRDLLPAGVTFLVGLDASRLLGSELVRDLLPLFGREATELRRTVESVADRCGLSLTDDLGETVLASFGAKSPNAVAIASGRFRDATVSRCMELLLSSRGSSLERIEVEGHPALKSSRDADHAWVALPSDRLLVLAGSRSWLARTLDLGTPRFSDRPSDVRDLLDDLPAGRALWAAGVVPSASEPARLAEGVAGAPMLAFYGYLELDDGFRAELGAVMKSPDGAGKLIEFLESYLASSKELLEERGLARYASKLELRADGRVARVRLALDRAEVDRLLAQLSPAEGRR